MSKGELLGHIDCPACGTKGGMRVTADKNGAPFGYCEAECDVQLRIGGKESRVRKFYILHPHLRKPGAAPVAPAAPSEEDAAETAGKGGQGAKPEPTPKPQKPNPDMGEKGAPKPRRNSWLPIVGLGGEE